MILKSFNFALQNRMQMRKLTTDELNRMSKEEFETTPKMPIIMVLDNVRSLNNVGAVFRTADAFCIQEIFLCGITACPPHREIHKTALGADETVAWRYFDTTEKACEELKRMGYAIVAVEQVDDSTMLNKMDIKPRTAFIMGNEVNGVGDGVLLYCDGAVELPQKGTKHSLNVSVCAGIVMWTAFEQLCKL